MFYKIFEIVPHKLFEKRNGPYYDEVILHDHFLKDCEKGKWTEFTLIEEAQNYITENKEDFRGKELTILPIIRVGYFD